MLLLLLLQAIWPILTVHAANEPYTGIDWKTVAGCEEKREENFYVLGCNQVFYRCYDGHAYEYKCPSNLYFDPKRNRCNHLDKTSTCLDEAEYKNKLVRGIKPFDCTGRDGSFEHPESRCDHVYYTCVHGRPIRQQCREEHVFDERRNMCDFKHNVKSCKNSRRRKISGPIPPSPSYAPYNPVISSPAPPPVPPQGNDDREFNCLNRPDGEYSIGECSNVFWKCANNKAFKYKCPMDLVYNDLTKRCLQKEDIPACKPFDREAARQNFDCSTKVDGYYEKERCQPYFYSCVAGRTEVLECTTGLVFDARISACDYPLACKSPLATAVTSPNPAADHGSINDGLLGPSIPQPCSHGKDGLFSVQKCSTAYVQCLSGVAFPMNCPVGLVFNEANGYCDYPESCLRSPPVIPAVANSPSAASSISYGKISLAVQLPCSSGAEGPFAVGKCFNSYMQCVNGTAITMSCPAGLVFNELGGYCDYPANCPWITCKELENGAHPVAQCRAEYVSCWEGAKSESRCPGNFIFNPHNGQCDYEQNVPECLNRGRAVQQPLNRVKAVEPPRRLVAADPFCIGRTDGYYSDRCSSEYNACIAGKFYKLKCPGTLKFSQSLQRCEPDNEVEECTNPCITRGDGIHQLGCQNKYLVCFSGNARWFSCPAGLIYNRVTASCEDSSRVPECRLY